MPIVALLLFATSAVGLTNWQSLCDQVQTVSQVTDGVIRNYQITATYYQLAIGLSEVTGSTSKDPVGYQGTWPHLATWASNSVGISIRKELPDELLTTILKEANLPSWLVDLINKSAALADLIFGFLLETTSESLAGGNLLVFADIGSALARFGLYFHNTTAPNETLWNEFYKTFNLSDSMEVLVSQGCRAYYNAMWLAGDAKVEQIFYGNMLVSVGEQMRLQPYIENSFPGNVSFSIPLLGKFTFDPAPIITQLMLTVFLPNELLFTSNDVPPRPWDGLTWTPALTSFDNATVEDYYLIGLNQTETTEGSAASNWISLHDRLKYIFPLFRSRQDDLSAITCPPFTSRQLAEIWASQEPNAQQLCYATCCASKL